MAEDIPIAQVVPMMQDNDNLPIAREYIPPESKTKERKKVDFTSHYSPDLADLRYLKMLEDELKRQEKYERENRDLGQNSANAWRVNVARRNLDEWLRARRVGESIKNKKNMNIAFTIGNKRQGKSFGVGIPGAAGADNLRNHIAQFLGGKRRKTRRKSRKKRKKTRKTRRRRKPKKITIVGYPSCDYYIKARRAAKSFFGKSNVTDIKFSTKLKYKNWLKKKDGIKFSNKAKSHKTCPFVWTGNRKYIGGCDDTLVLIKKLKKKHYK